MFNYVFLFLVFFFSILGKRLGKAMGAVAKEVKSMSQADILLFEQTGEATFSGHCLKQNDIKVQNFGLEAHLLELSSI